MSTATAPPRRMPVRVAHLDFSDLFDGAYAGWWADLRVNVPLTTMRGLSGDWETRKASLSELVVAWNFVDSNGNDVDPKDTSIWDAIIPTDLLRAVSDRFDEQFNEMTALPKASAPPSSNTS